MGLVGRHTSTHVALFALSMVLLTGCNSLHGVDYALVLKIACVDKKLLPQSASAGNIKENHSLRS